MPSPLREEDPSVRRLALSVSISKALAIRSFGADAPGSRICTSLGAGMVVYEPAGGIMGRALEIPVAQGTGE